MIVATGLSSCEKENVGEGRFRVAMTDAPADYAALDVQITGVRVYHDNQGWITLNDQAQTVNVLSLQNGIESEIALSGTVAAGHYSQLMITFGDENSITLAGAAANATVGMQFSGDHEVVIDIDAEVSAQADASVLVDFDVARSVVEAAGTYFLRPMMHEIRDLSTGIRGEVFGTASAMVLLTNGDDSLSTYTDASGHFLLRGMAPGQYVMQIMPRAKLPTQPAPDPITLQGVIIVKGQIREAGQFQF